MPISAPGCSIAELSPPALSRAGRERGFTLLEVLVAITIVAVLMGAVGLSVRSADRSLQADTERIAVLLSLAREEAQVRGAPIRFEADDVEYRFLIRRGPSWQPLLDDRDLRRREWGGPTKLTLVRSDGRSVIEFGRDVVDSPFELRLERDRKTGLIYANGLGMFEVRR